MRIIVKISKNQTLFLLCLGLSHLLYDTIHSALDFLVGVGSESWHKLDFIRINGVFLEFLHSELDRVHEPFRLPFEGHSSLKLLEMSDNVLNLFPGLRSFAIDAIVILAGAFVSESHTIIIKGLVEPKGVEPLTSCVQNRRSSQLS